MDKSFIIKKVQLLLGLLIFLTSCGGSSSKERQKLNPEQIESKYSSGVVLIKNTYYYTISFNGGNAFYFTGIDKDGAPENLTLDPNELTPATSFGTGFFISKDGLIATNLHVASPSIDISSVRSSIVNAFQVMANEWSKEVNEINEKLGIVQLAILSADNYSDKDQYEQLYNELVDKRDSMQEAVNMVNSLGGMDYEAALHADLGIAYNDTHVTNISDFHSCVTVADDPSCDLAIIQLKDKITPQNKHVFKVPKGRVSEKANNEENAPKRKIKVGKKIYMIGFNLGPTLALTNQGVKAQITSGEVSQNTDDARIMYTVPALHGSSGSPIIDEYGKLLAVNYAGLDITQNFNYGIKVSHLRDLLNKLNNNE